MPRRGPLLLLCCWWRLIRVSNAFGMRSRIVSSTMGRRPFHTPLAASFSRVSRPFNTGKSYGWRSGDVPPSRKRIRQNRYALAAQSTAVATVSGKFQIANSTTESSPADWILSHKSSEYVTHVLMESDENDETVVNVVDDILQRKRANETAVVTNLSALELLDLGAVWFLPAASRCKDVKPTRLGVENATSLLLEPGDYLRIHHMPRRFPVCANYNWSAFGSDTTTDDKPGVMVAEDSEKGYLVIDKPARVPVHKTVDNAVENVAECIRRARVGSSGNEDVYVTVGQRLDQNTSGLLVVSTKPEFAAYFAHLLRNKTKQELLTSRQDGNDRIDAAASCIRKHYKCLVCLLPTAVSSEHDEPWSVSRALGQLEDYAKDGTILRHYMEPSIRAPKRVLAEAPPSADVEWLECLLKIQSVGSVCALVGNDSGTELEKALWGNDDENQTSAVDANSSSFCPSAVVELEVELLTGRTHQIRAQLSAAGFPLVGDVQYGGAVASSAKEMESASLTRERLALQCCELEFRDPDIFVNAKGELSLKPSQRWNRFRLENAWWTPFLERYREQQTQETTVTTDASDVGLVQPPPTPPMSTTAMRNSATDSKQVSRPHLLPDRVSLSPGKRKYVLLRADPFDVNESTQWFVKSAAPAECGGPYHGNVAQDLREWVEAAGYNVTVTGGGRIDYNPTAQTALVYGFSYGFGKGDHKHAAELIRESGGGVEATFDDTPGLY